MREVIQFMLEVENLSPFTRAFSVNGKEFIFRANQTRSDIPDYFLNTNGTIRFAGLIKLKRIIQDNGDSKRVYNVDFLKDREHNWNQEYTYIFENIASGEIFKTLKLAEFCRQHKLVLSSIRVYIKKGKPYKGWNITRERMPGYQGDSEEDVDDIMDSENDTDLNNLSDKSEN